MDLQKEKELTRLFNKLTLSEVFNTYALTLDMLSEGLAEGLMFDQLLLMQDMLQFEIYIRMDL
jgi:hypothetical protein